MKEVFFFKIWLTLVGLDMAYYSHDVRLSLLIVVCIQSKLQMFSSSCWHRSYEFYIWNKIRWKETENRCGYKLFFIFMQNTHGSHSTFGIICPNRIYIFIIGDDKKSSKVGNETCKTQHFFTWTSRIWKKSLPISFLNYFCNFSCVRL